jgi:hypothetical protein
MGVFIPRQTGRLTFGRNINLSSAQHVIGPDQSQISPVHVNPSYFVKIHLKFSSHLSLILPNGFVHSDSLAKTSYALSSLLCNLDASYISDPFILSRVLGGCAWLIDGFSIGWLNLLTPHTQNSELQSIERYRWSTHYKSLHNKSS